MSDFFLANPGRWGATGAGTGIEGAEAIGDAKRQKKEVNVAATDAIDATLPNVLGTVIEVKKGQSAYPTWKVVVAVEKVEFTGGKRRRRSDADSIGRLRIATKRLPPGRRGPKGGALRIFRQTRIARLDGVLNVDIKANKNGPNEKALTS